jgi:nitrite transporter NirC
LYIDTTREFAKIAATKIRYLNRNPFGFLISSMMAGAYVGVGIILILTLGNTTPPESVNLVMGTFFGITLTLIVFAGAELYSGHTMFMTFGFLHRTVSVLDILKDWIVSWNGNLLGAFLLSLLFILGGGGGWADDPSALVHRIAESKATSSVVELLARGMICNWLICLAIWMTQRTKSDIAKCVLIFWCLFAFVAAGFEHGVANMTVFSISLLGSSPEPVSFASALNNLVWVSFGNLIGGAGFIGVGYYLTNMGKEDLDTDDETQPEK